METLYHCGYCPNAYHSKEKKDAHEKVCDFIIKNARERFKEKYGMAARSK